MDIVFFEHDFIVKNLTSEAEIEAGLRLRHDVFAGELRWVPPSPDGLEKDDYEPFSEYVGVFDMDGNMAGHARLITSPLPFMVEKEFLCMMPKDTEFRKSPGLTEITRLCVRKEDRAEHASRISQLLYKGIYQWSLNNSVRNMIMVVDNKYFRLLRLSGFPVEQLADFVLMPDGVKAGAISLDWRAFEDIQAVKRPGFLDWMSTIPAPYPSQSQSHALYSRHSASSRYSAHGT